MNDKTNMVGGLFDIGVNLNSGQYNNRVDEILARAHEHGVSELIAIASDVAESKALDEYPDFENVQVWTTAGVHPHQAKTFDATTIEKLKSCYENKRCIAIGECGLDYNRMYSPKDDQRRAFIDQIELANSLKAPLYLHQRDAHDDFMEILKRREGLAGVVHCFTDGPEVLRDYLDMGLYVGITGWVCDERRGQSLRDALQLIPLDRLLLETDAPYLKPRNYKGPMKLKSNEPCLLPHIAAYVADQLKLSVEKLTKQTRENTYRLFGLGDP